MNSDERAYELLKWQSLAPIGDFDPTFPYFDVWKKASDKALDEFERDSYYETSDQMKAFQYLERLGVYTKSDYYSPSKAKDDDHNYVTELREHQERVRRNTADRAGVARPEAGADSAPNQDGATRGMAAAERQRTRPHGRNARYGNSAWRRRRGEGRATP